MKDLFLMVDEAYALLNQKSVYYSDGIKVTVKKETSKEDVEHAKDLLYKVLFCAQKKGLY